MGKRLYLLVLDGLGLGALPDAGCYGDLESNTLAAVTASNHFYAPNLQALGLFNIAGAAGRERSAEPVASFGRMALESMGKDSTVGHWEMAGVITEDPPPVFYKGFAQSITDYLYSHTFRRILCNRRYDEGEVLRDFGRQHIRTGDVILYTGDDSVMQFAAHEGMMPLRDLYELCDVARSYMQGHNGVVRVVARPFVGDPPDFTFTANSKEYSLAPPQRTMLDFLSKRWLDVIAIGNIYDLFTGLGITRTIKTRDNVESMNQAAAMARTKFSGLCYVNIASFNRRYGGYDTLDDFATAISQFDQQLGDLAELLGPEDAIIITGDRGSDPVSTFTRSSREYLPMLIFGKGIRQGIDLGTRSTAADISATVQEFFDLEVQTAGRSFLQNVIL